ncbi:hypothetical protein [Rhizobium hainanense]|uniref:Uncharacterized protein n=1 Tax=Rhizobium hainanense TaxID=52131 RepID=A0A1C3UTD5_9HYPH|nr:hypothetical protein [Rhizobium hainanense]SCB18715.1 hypothetical protein GA0061100_103162 [Rhizobium hainanense]
MISNLLASLFATFALGPLQAEIERHAAAAGQPVEIVRQSQACLSSEVPALVQRASDDTFWTISTVISLSTGWSSPADLLDKNNPACAPVIKLIQGRSTGADEA